MAKRIIINIIVAFGILPAVNPFLVYLNAIIFGYDFPKYFVWNGPRGFYNLWWGSFLFYYSIFILIFVISIYNVCIIAKVKNTSSPFSFAVKFLIFFILLSLLALFYNSDFYLLGGRNIMVQKIIVLIVLSAITATLHYILIDRKYEKRMLKQRQ